MTEEKLNEYYSCGEIIPKEAHMQSHGQSIRAQKITMEMNTRFHTPEELNELFSELTGKKVTDINIFPPFSPFPRWRACFRGGRCWEWSDRRRIYSRRFA